jgi:hypothetical protein
MFRSHITKITAALLLALALSLASVPARAAGFAAERSSAWAQLAERLFGWLMKYSGCIDPNGGAPSCPGISSIAPDAKPGSAAPATLCLDSSQCIDPNGRH